MSDSLQTLWTVACQAPLFMEFCRQECWSGLPCPAPEDLPDTGVKPASPTDPALQADSLPLSHQGSRTPIILLDGGERGRPTLTAITSPLWAAPKAQWVSPRDTI